MHISEWADYHSAVFSLLVSMDLHYITVCRHPNVAPSCHSWTAHPWTTSINLMLKQPPLFLEGFGLGCRDLLPLSRNSIGEARRWWWRFGSPQRCWMKTVSLWTQGQCHIKTVKGPQTVSRKLSKIALHTLAWRIPLIKTNGGPAETLKKPQNKSTRVSHTRYTVYLRFDR